MPGVEQGLRGGRLKGEGRNWRTLVILSTIKIIIKVMRTEVYIVPS